LVASDEWLSPQAAVLSPNATWAIASAIVAEQDPLRRTLAAGLAAIRVLNDGVVSGQLQLSTRERQWLGRIERELSEMPGEQELTARMFAQHAGRFDAASYGLTREG
jgi:hypothetical protein